MYLKDKDFRISIRLNQAQYNFIKAHSDLIGVTPSQFLRMVVNANMAVENQTWTEQKVLKPKPKTETERIKELAVHEDADRLWRVKDKLSEEDVQVINSDELEVIKDKILTEQDEEEHANQ